MPRCQVCKTPMPRSRSDRKTCSGACRAKRMRRMQKLHILRRPAKTCEYGTPQYLFSLLNRRFHFTLDVCASHTNHKCPRYFTKKDNCLKQHWGKHEVVWMNPPYGTHGIGAFLKKALESACTVVALVPAKTDTDWWFAYIAGRNDAVMFIDGRLRFEGAKHPAPFPSAIVVYRPKRVKIPSGVFDIVAWGVTGRRFW